MVSLINYYVDRGIESFSEKQWRFESIRPSWGFLTTRHMQVPDLHISTFIRILQNVNRSTLPESTVLHLLVPFLDGFTGCVHATLAISHSQCVVVFSHDGIAKVLGLP